MAMFLSQQESQLFQKRLNNIFKELDEEMEIPKPVSKERLRVNKNGINLKIVEARRNSSLQQMQQEKEN